MNPVVHSRREREAAPLSASIAFGLAIASAAYWTAAPDAYALSEIQREELPAPSTGHPAPPTSPDEGVPFPDQINPVSPDDRQPGDQAPADQQVPDDQQVPETPENAGPTPDAPLPAIEYDLSKLPEPVQRTRSMILEAAKSGDIENLRPLIGMGDAQTQLALGGIEGDPIKYLRDLSGDEQGQEILAIIEEVLSAGYVHMEPGSASDVYVWPYFFAIPLGQLTPAQRVELFKIVTAGDYEDMKAYDAYIFYRIGITPEGKWSFFIAGD